MEWVVKHFVSTGGRCMPAKCFRELPAAAGFILENGFWKVSLGYAACRNFFWKVCLLLALLRGSGCTFFCSFFFCLSWTFFGRKAMLSSHLWCREETAFIPWASIWASRFFFGGGGQIHDGFQNKIKKDPASLYETTGAVKPKNIQNGFFLFFYIDQLPSIPPLFFVFFSLV